MLLAHGGEHGAGDAKEPDDIRIEDDLRLLRGEGFGYAGRHDAGIVDQHIDLTGLHQHSLDARFDRCVVANVQFHGHDAELSQGLGGLSVLALRTTHRGVHSVASAEQRFRRVTAKAAASAGDQDCFGHTLKGFHTVFLLCCDTSVRGCDLTMLPPLPPCRVERRRAAATVQSIVPTTLTAKRRVRESASCSSTRAVFPVIPALLTRVGEGAEGGFGGGRDCFDVGGLLTFPGIAAALAPAAWMAE